MTQGHPMTPELREAEAVEWLAKSLRDPKNFIGQPLDNLQQSFEAAKVAVTILAALRPHEGGGVWARVSDEARRYASFYPEASDGRNTFIIFAEWADKQADSPAPPSHGGEVTRKEIAKVGQSVEPPEKITPWKHDSLEGFEIGRRVATDAILALLQGDRP